MINLQNPSAWDENAPTTFSELSFADDYTREDLYEYVQFPMLCGNIILEGGSGSGKSTIASVIANERLGVSPSLYKLNGASCKGDTFDKMRRIFDFGRLCDEIPIIIINEVDRLESKQFEFRDFLDDNEQKILVVMTTNHLSKIDSSIVDRSDVFRMRGFVPQQAVTVAQRVLKRYAIAVNDGDLVQVFQRNLIGDETELSLRQIGRTVDKLVRQSGKVLKRHSVKTRLTVV